MTIRIGVLAALALALIIGGFAALWVGIGYVLDPGPTSALEEDMEAWERRWMWLQVLVQAGGPLVGAGLIVGVGALALVVRARTVPEA